ncbi:MAG: PilZ domain-containing protein [Pseudomonadales bacterium]
MSAIYQRVALERRRHARKPIQAIVILRHPALGELKTRAIDMSDGGLFVDTGCQLGPPVGAVVQVMIKRLSGPLNEHPINMQVIHRRDSGLGLKFT